MWERNQHQVIFNIKYPWKPNRPTWGKCQNFDPKLEFFSTLFGTVCCFSDRNRLLKIITSIFTKDLFLNGHQTQHLVSSALSCLTESWIFFVENSFQTRISAISSDEHLLASTLNVVFQCDEFPLEVCEFAIHLCQFLSFRIRALPLIPRFVTRKTVDYWDWWKRHENNGKSCSSFGFWKTEKLSKSSSMREGHKLLQGPVSPIYSTIFPRETQNPLFSSRASVLRTLP